MPPEVWSWLEASYPYRLVLGLAFFLVLGLVDWRRHPEDPRRAKEYLFLVYAALAAIVYAVLHDQITVSLSPEYFLLGKGLVHDHRNLGDEAHRVPWHLRLDVAVLAVHASYGVGALAGAALLIANNPSKTRAQVPYRPLLRLALLPLACAAVAAVVGGVVNRTLDPMDLAHDLRGEVKYEAVRPFVLVQGVHAGSYAGAVLGSIAAVVLVRRRRGPALATSSSAPPPS